MYLITGCNGLIGSYLARRLLAQGKHVRALKRTTSKLDFVSDIQEQIEWHTGDILDIFSLQDAMQDVEYVIHAAAMVSLASTKRDQMYKVNVEGTTNVVNVALELGIKKLCHVSSIAAIGHPPDSHAQMNETQKWQSQNTSNYAESKYLAEMEVWRGVVEGLEAVIVNPSAVLGYHDWNSSSTQIFKHIYQGLRFFPTGKLNYVDIRDVAQCIDKLLHSSITAERFILNADSILFDKIFEMIATKMNKKKPSIPLSGWLGAIAWRADAIKSWLLRKESQITKHTIRTTRSHYHYQNTKVKEALGFEFTPLEQTLDWACARFLEKMSLSMDN